MGPRAFRVREFLAVLILVLSLGVSAFGQLGKGVITGTVTDPSNASVPGASVSLTHESTGSTRTATTSSAGLFRFDFADVGSYTLKISAANFSTTEVRGVILTVAQTVTQDVKLELARGAAQTITVEASGIQLIQTDKSEVSGLVDRTSLTALPLEVRDPVAFVNLLPGAIPSSLGNYEFNGSTRGSAVNGARGGTGNFVLDGFDNNDQGQGGRSHNSVGSMPGGITGVSPDAIQEFRVVTNNFSAQYGRQAGFVADAVMRSGSNDVHGSAFLYNRNRAITANDFFSNRGETRDALVRNQFGGSLGGPIKRDKTFIFGTVEIQRLRQDAPNIITSATPAFLDFVNTGAFADFMETDPNGFCNSQDAWDLLYGDGSPGSSGALAGSCPGAFADSRTLGPIAQQLQQKYPMPVPTSNFTTRSSGLFFGGFRYPVPIFGDADVRNSTRFNENRASIRFDHEFSANDRINILFAYDDFDSVDSSTGTDTTGSPYFPITALSRSQNWGLTWTHMFSPSVINEAKFGFLRHNGEFPRDVDPTTPSIVTAFDALTVGYGLTSGLPQNFTDNQFQYQDHLSIVQGRHTLKTGFEYRRTRNGSVFAANRDGFFLPYDSENLLTDGWFGSNTDFAYFSNLNTTYGLWGTPDELALEDIYGGFYDAEASINPSTNEKPEYYRGYRANEFGFYVQDDWKISSRVTLNLGLRWDYYGPPHNFRPGYDSNFYFGDAATPIVSPSNNPFFPFNSPEYAREANATFQLRDSEIWAKDKNNFAPRFGLAWDVTGNKKTVVRFGGGVYYDRFWNNLFENIRFNPPLFSFNQIGTFLNGFPASPTSTPGIYAIPIDTALWGNPTFKPKASPRHMDENMVAPYMEQAFFGIQQELSSNMVLEVNYIGTFGHKLTGVVDLNTFPGRAIPLFNPDGSRVYSTRRPNNSIARDNARGNFYNSNYHALQMTLSKRMSHGLQFMTNYTYSKALDYMSDAFNNRGSGSGGVRPMDTMARDLDYGRADFDLRHRSITSVYYELPFWKSNKWAGGWQIGGALTLQTGLPFSVIDTGTDYNADGNVQDRPDFIAPGDPNLVSFNRAISPADDGYFQTSLFAAPALEPSVNMGLWRNGRLGRNVLTNPGYANTDVSFKKQFDISERWKLKIEGNFFNVFNRVNYGIIDGGMTSGTFGRATNTFGPRSGQLAARIEF